MGLNYKSLRKEAVGRKGKDEVNILINLPYF